MIVKEALSLAQTLQHSDTPRLDAEVLLAQVLGKTRTFLYTWPEHLLSDKQIVLYQQWLARRAAGEPVAHIVQCREFWSLSLEVNASTLIPRPDTEVLVERALALVLDEAWTTPRILDLGTGTGAIALALASELPLADLVAVDASPDAVALAQRNARRLQLKNVVTLHSDWWTSVQGLYDLIVSNPPYIDPQDPHLALGDVRFEPLSALVAADNGLADIQHIITHAPNYLNDKGWLMLEHGWQQMPLVRQLLQKRGFTDIFCQKDYAGNDRVSGGRWEAVP